MLEERRCPVCGETYLPLVENCRRDGTPLVVISTLIDKVLDQRYRLDRILGYGGMGVVYHATHVRTNQERAVKVLHPEMMEKEGMLQRFQTEAIAAAKIDNDKAVKIVDFQVTQEKLAYLVMEMVEGVVLRKLITPQGMDYQRTVEILCQICEAVHAAHEKKIIHRDLKPDNVIVKRTGNQDLVKVLDFGIAKLREAENDSPNAPQTKVGTIMGTPQYMSPEQCRGIRSEDLKPASDVYSIGIIAYEMLCGRVPFDGANMLELIDKHKHEPPEHIKTINPSVPISIGNVVMRTLAKMPEDRWASAEKLAQELRIAVREARGGKTQPGEVIVTEVITGGSKTTPLTFPNQISFDRSTKDAGQRQTIQTPPVTPPPIITETQVSPQSKWLKMALVAAAIVLVAGVAAYWLWPATQSSKPSEEFSGMVLIQGGKFIMGRNDGEEDERPAHEMEVKDFYLDKLEVTNEQYKKFVDATGHRAPLNWRNGAFSLTDTALPVTNISWTDADAYARWARKRLPTEAEWEYAARGGGKEFLYPWGNQWNQENANVGRRIFTPLPGGTFRADVSPFGVFDLGGNVSEWVQDNYLDYLTNRPADSGCPECKVYRGSNYGVGTNVDRKTNTYRWSFSPDIPTDEENTKRFMETVAPVVGFRCAKDKP